MRWRVLLASIYVVAVTGCEAKTTTVSSDQSKLAAQTAPLRPLPWECSPEFARMQSESQAAAMRSGAADARGWQEAERNTRAQQSRDAEAARARAGIDKETHRQTLELVERAIQTQLVREGTAKALAQEAVGRGVAALLAEEGEQVKVQFVKPEGTRERDKAKDVTVPSKLKLEWKPDEAIIVQVYQGNKLVKEWKDVRSGSEFALPGTGETELKIWAGGRDTPDDAIWVWIK